MKSTVLSKSKFKKVKLFTNKIALTELEKFIENKIILTELFKEEAKKVLKRDLAPIELIKIAESDLSFIEDEIKAQYLFDNSDDEFNLKALGVDLTAVREAHAKLQSYPIKFIVEYDTRAQKYVCKSDERERVLEQTITYTSNQYQNNVYNAGLGLIKALERCQKLGFIMPTTMVDMRNVTKQVITTEYEGNKLRFTINPLVISAIREIDNEADSY